MEEQIKYKFCPICETKNTLQDVLCFKCFSDISSVEPLNEIEYENMKKTRAEKSSRKNSDTEMLFSDFKSAFGNSEKNKSVSNSSGYRLYERTKEDEEAEKILAELKENAVKIKDQSIKKSKEILSATKDKAGDLFNEISSKLSSKK